MWMHLILRQIILNACAFLSGQDRWSLGAKRSSSFTNQWKWCTFKFSQWRTPSCVIKCPSHRQSAAIETPCDAKLQSGKTEISIVRRIRSEASLVAPNVTCPAYNRSPGRMRRLMWDTAQCTGPLSLPPLIDRPAEPQHRAASQASSGDTYRCSRVVLLGLERHPDQSLWSADRSANNMHSHTHCLLLLLPPVAPLDHRLHCSHATSCCKLQSKSLGVALRDRRKSRKRHN